MSSTPIADLYTNIKTKQDFKKDWAETTKDDWKEDFASNPIVVKPVSNFSGTPLSGVSPLTVVFTDSSTNTPVSWAWDFGDSGVATTQNPTYVYSTPGTYTVKLTATNTAGSSIKTRTAYITVS